MVADNPTVFIIDDDPGMRAAIEGLLESVGLPSESFGSAKEFLDRRGAERALLSGSRCAASR